MLKETNSTARALPRLLLAALTLFAALPVRTATGQTAQPVSYEKLLADSSSRLKDDKADQVQEVLSLLGAGGKALDAAGVVLELKRNWPAYPAGSPIMVPADVRPRLMLEGKENDRLQSVVKPLLAYAGLVNRVRLLVFRSEVPITMFVHPNALLVSTRALVLLDDKELEAECAHEVVHLIPQQLYRAAVDAGDYRTQRLVELFCDAGAAALIFGRGGDPRKLISGHDKMASVLEVEFQDHQGKKHPALKQRKQLNEALLKEFTSATTAATLAGAR
jgi:hypothetical protein